MQEIFDGYGSIKYLSEILKFHNPKKIFLVTAKASYVKSGAESIINPILSGYNYNRFFDFDVNPRVESIIQGVEHFNKEKCDFIIAIGGGSVLDTAKAISILVNNGKDIVESIKHNTALNKRTVPLALIPTTAGTGSESTHFSVVYINNEKYSLANDSMKSDYVFLDPTFIESLPPYVAACSGMDALCQGIESYWSVNSTEESRSYSKKAIELALNNITGFVNSPDRENRNLMLLASNYAGRAIDIAKTTAAHAVSYPITSYFNIPHGHAVALTLPYFIEYNCNINETNIQDKRGLQFVKSVMSELLNILGVKDGAEAKNKIIEIMKTINLETGLIELGISEKDHELIIVNGFNPQRVKNNPKILTKEELEIILKLNN